MTPKLQETYDSMLAEILENYPLLDSKMAAEALAHSFARIESICNALGSPLDETVEMVQEQMKLKRTDPLAAEKLVAEFSRKYI